MNITIEENENKVICSFENCSPKQVLKTLSQSLGAVVYKSIKSETRNPDSIHTVVFGYVVPEIMKGVQSSEEEQP